MSSVLTMVLTAVILWKLWEWVVDFVFLQCYKIFFRSHFSFLTLPIFFSHAIFQLMVRFLPNPPTIVSDAHFLPIRSFCQASNGLTMKEGLATDSSRISEIPESQDESQRVRT